MCILDCRYVISDRPWRTTSEGPPWFWLLQQAQPGQQQRLRAVLAALSQRCAGRCRWCGEKTCLSDRQPFKSLTGFWGRFHPLSIIQSPTNLGTYRNKVPPLLGGKKKTLNLSCFITQPVHFCHKYLIFTIPLTPSWIQPSFCQMIPKRAEKASLPHSSAALWGCWSCPGLPTRKPCALLSRISWTTPCFHKQLLWQVVSYSSSGLNNFNVPVFECYVNTGYFRKYVFLKTGSKIFSLLCCLLRISTCFSHLQTESQYGRGRHGQCLAE